MTKREYLQEAGGNCGIYTITNKLTGEVYIGGSTDIYHRWYHHLSKNAVRGLRQSIEKHGIENHTWPVIILHLPEFTPNSIMEFFEKKYLHEYIKEGYTLMNINKTGGRGRTNVPVHQYDKEGNLIKTYQSMKAAATDNGIFVGGIGMAASGKAKTYEGYIWKRVQE